MWEIKLTRIIPKNHKVLHLSCTRQECLSSAESELFTGDTSEQQSFTRTRIGRLVPSSHQRSELSNTILGTFSRGDKRVWKCIESLQNSKNSARFIHIFPRDLNLDTQKYVWEIKLTRIIPKNHKVPHLSCTRQECLSGAESELFTGDTSEQQSFTRTRTGRLVPSSHQRSELSNTILGIFGRGDKRVWKCIELLQNSKISARFIHIFQLSNSMGWLDTSFESTFWEYLSLAFLQTCLVIPHPGCKVSEWEVMWLKRASWGSEYLFPCSPEIMNLFPYSLMANN